MSLMSNAFLAKPLRAPFGTGGAARHRSSSFAHSPACRRTIGHRSNHFGGHSMKHWVSRLGLAAVCTAIALPAGAAMPTFQFDPQQMPETVGTPRDPAEHMAEMAQLQQRLAIQQVERGARAEAVVNVTPAEKRSIDIPTSSDGRYLVGVNKAIGAA